MTHIDLEFAQRIRLAKVLVAVNALALTANLLMTAFWILVKRNGGAMEAMLLVPLSLGVYAAIGLANVSGLAGSAILGLIVKDTRRAVTLLLVSAPSLALLVVLLLDMRQAVE